MLLGRYVFNAEGVTTETLETDIDTEVTGTRGINPLMGENGVTKGEAL